MGGGGNKKCKKNYICKGNLKIKGNLTVKGLLKACNAYIKNLTTKNLTSANANITGTLTWTSDNIINQNVTFQLVDGEGYTVDNTEFSVVVKIIKRGNEVSLYFPVINFQIGQTSTEDPYGNTIPPTGYLRTTSNYLPKQFSPNSLSYQTTLAASGKNQIVPYSFSNTLFIGSMEAPIYEGYVSPTVFQGYIANAGYILSVTSIVSGPGLFIGSTLFSTGVPATVLPVGTTIISISPDGPGTYEFNGIAGPLGSPINPVTFNTQSLLEITQIVQGASPIAGTTITGPGLGSDVVVSSGANVNSDGTGSYFLNSPTATTTGQPIPVTITANLLNVLSVTNFFAGNPLRPGMIIYGQGISAGTVVIAYASGTGQNGTYVVNNNQTFPSTQIEAANPPGTFALQPLNDPGYQLRVGPRGDIAIMASQGKYSFNSQYGLPAGNHALLPTKMSYLLIEPTVLKNFVINADMSNITQWPNYQENAFYGAFGSAYRDTQVCSIQNNNAVFTSASNGNQVGAPPQPGLANVIGGISDGTGVNPGTTLIVTVVNYGYINPGAILSGTGVTAGTTVVSVNSDGTYTVTPSQLVVAGTSITVTTGPGQANGVSDVSISIGTVSTSGTYTPNPGYPTYLTNNGSNITNTALLTALPNYAQDLTMNPPVYCPVYVFCTASTINPTNEDNIVISWGLGNVPTFPMRAVTFDGGNTWTANGPLNIQPSGGGGGGDNRAATFDKYGTCWYNYTNGNPVTGVGFDFPIIGASPDGGLTFYVGYQAPTSLYSSDGSYDTPHFNFGYDGNGNYGIFMNCDYFPSYGQSLSLFDDIASWTGFLPITGPMSATTTATVTGSVSPLVVTVGSVTSGSSTLTISDVTVVFVPGQAISGSGIPSGTYIISGSAGSFVMSANATATVSNTQIVGAVTLTVTSVTVGSLSVGQKICGNNLDPTIYINPNTSIIGLVTGTGGIGTYSLDISQITPSTTIYAAVIPLGPVQLTGTSTSISPLSDGDLLAIQTTIYVASIDGFLEAGYLQINGYTIVYNGQSLAINTTVTGSGGSGIVNVVSTEGFLGSGSFYYTPISTGIPVIVQYSGITPTSFTGSIGLPATIIAGDTINADPAFTGCQCFDSAGFLTVGSPVNVPGTPSILYNQVGTTPTTATVISALDGRIWTIGGIDFYGAPFACKFKSPTTNSQYTDIVSANWSGPWLIGDNYYNYPNEDGSGQIAFPTFGFFNDDVTAIFDEVRQTIYAAYAVNPLPGQQDMTIYLIWSRNNGLSWSDPIIVSSSNIGNRGIVSLAQDQISGNLILSWYDGRNTSPSSPTAYQTIQSFGAIILASQLDQLNSLIPLSNPTFQSPSAILMPAYATTNPSTIS
jgi:hypothetical protein